MTYDLTQLQPPPALNLVPSRMPLCSSLSPFPTYRAQPWTLCHIPAPSFSLMLLQPSDLSHRPSSFPIFSCTLRLNFDSGEFPHSDPNLNPHSQTPSSPQAQCQPQGPRCACNGLTCATEHQVST